MKRTERIVETNLEGELGDLSIYCGSREDLLRLSVRDAFLGKPVGGGEFRIPAADTGKEIFFNNREMLSRFASMSKIAQEVFIQSVRRAMLVNNVVEISLTVPWSDAGKTKVIKIRELNSEGYLNIYI